MATSKQDKKGKTCKSRRETAVQGTNDSSIVSKCSMSNVGYFNDPFLQCFVSKTTRRSPLIHRGYFIRAKTIDHILRRFLLSYHGKKQIVSLGAGFDSAYFRLKSENLLNETSFYEVDFPDVVKRKFAVIDNTEILQSLITGYHSQGPKQDPLIEIHTAEYKLLGVDLTQLNTLEALLKLCGMDFDVPTLLLSECVLTYMTRRCSSAVVKWGAETFPESVFVLYEQINPDDAFGIFMQNHFQLIGSPLKCINAFPTIGSQKERFHKLGWSRCEAMDMNNFYRYLVPSEERGRIENLEPFDEYEEWHLKCAHYMVACASNGHAGQSLIQDKNGYGNYGLKDCLSITHRSVSNAILRFGHSSTLVDDGQFLVSLGGFGEECGKHRRIVDITVTDIRTLESHTVPVKVNPREVQVSRMHDQSLTLSDGSILLIGGRMSPVQLCTQLIKLTLVSNKNDDRKVSNKNQAGQQELDDAIHAICISCGSKPLSCDQCSLSCDLKENLNPSHVTIVDEDGIRTSHERRNESSENYVKIEENRPDKPEENKHSENYEKNKEILPDVSIRNVNKRSVEKVFHNNDTLKQDTDNSSEDMKFASDNIAIDSNKGNHQDVEKFNEACIEILNQNGDIPCPRWRHAAVLFYKNDDEHVFVHGGKSDKELALDDSFILNIKSRNWTKVQSNLPGKRHSHTASLWNDKVILFGGLDEDLQPLNSPFIFDIQCKQYTELTLHEEVMARYSHSAHVIDNCLFVVGGVNVSHLPPGVVKIDLQSRKVTEFQLPEQDRQNLLMLHNHTSFYQGDGKILIVGGGGNCFSFGTHLNVTPLELNISKCLQD